MENIIEDNIDIIHHNEYDDLLSEHESVNDKEIINENSVEQDDDEKVDDNRNSIKHIVISGGGPAGFSFYGALRECHKKGIWRLEDIETLHGISIGSILITVLCLDYETEVIDDFLIKRPWQNLFKFNITSITNSFQKKGIFSKDVIKEVFLPLFKGKDLSIDITLKEFYEFSKKEMHIYATEIHNFALTDFSYKTHPDWKLIDVIYCSCAIPGIFMPYLFEGGCYCDGGIILNYPLKCCLENSVDPDTILGIKMMVDSSKKSFITEESTIFDYMLNILNELLFKGAAPSHIDMKPIKYEIAVNHPQLSIYNSYESLSSQEKRVELIEHGRKSVMEKLGC